MSRTIKIFDTTLRDGEQSPGCSMNLNEKIEVAKQLEALKVDIIEAGFAAASPGDAAAIAAIADTVRGATICSLARSVDKDIEAAYNAIRRAESARIHTFIKIYCKEHGIKYVEHTDFNEDVIADADILYMTRVQKERFSDLMEYERVKNVYILKNSMLGKAKPNMKILHPLPRVNEIAYDVDDNPHAYYIQQAGNGLFAREAIFSHVLGITLDEVKNDKTIIK